MNLNLHPAGSDTPCMAKTDAIWAPREWVLAYSEEMEALQWEGVGLGRLGE